MLSRVRRLHADVPSVGEWILNCVQRLVPLDDRAAEERFLGVIEFASKLLQCAFPVPNHSAFALKESAIRPSILSRYGVHGFLPFSFEFFFYLGFDIMVHEALTPSLHSTVMSQVDGAGFHLSCVATVRFSAKIVHKIPFFLVDLVARATCAYALCGVQAKEQRNGDDDLFVYDCPNIGDFEEFDRMFRISHGLWTNALHAISPSKIGNRMLLVQAVALFHCILAKGRVHDNAGLAYKKLESWEQIGYENECNLEPNMLIAGSFWDS
ncbi:hypothetical protein HPP92_013096 [Vanilla planifolia]|uniref:Uncharacterized protein n=1 Tax=Vanilla planifolia TaxID=51239 RepID=A0A835QMS3_VANPL|nr:hypothetical protein HPP92_013096 [Vanilla planifolia]